MSLAAVPVYLSRACSSSRRAAVIVAAASVDRARRWRTSTSIVPDVLAYPYFALCSLLAIRALAYRRRLRRHPRDRVPRRRLLRPPARVHAAAGHVRRRGGRPLGDRAARPRGPPQLEPLRHRRRDRAPRSALLFVVNHVVFSHVHEWQVTTRVLQEPDGRPGPRRRALSLSIGLGLLPVIGGIVSLRLPERRGDPAYRAFAAWTATAIAFLGLYIAEKAAYLSLTFATLWEERAADLRLPAAADRHGARLRGEAHRPAAVRRLGRLRSAPRPGEGDPARLALLRRPGLGDPRRPRTTTATGRRTAFGSGCSASSRCRCSLIAFRRRRGVAAATVVLGFAWLLAGQIAMTVGHRPGRDRLHPQPARRRSNWVDQADGGQPATYLGPGDQGPERREPDRVLEPVDPQGREPRRHRARARVRPSRRASSPPTAGSRASRRPYVVADAGIRLAEPVVATPNGAMVLYRAPNGPWHLLDAVQQVYSDGWCPRLVRLHVLQAGHSGARSSSPSAGTALRRLGATGRHRR